MSQANSGERQGRAGDPAGAAVQQAWTAAQERLILALDRPDGDSALALLERCPSIRRVKVGMELYYGSGGSVLPRLAEKGVEVFLDLKLHDIPNTVASACRALVRHGVWMLNVHASGGSRMMAAAAEALAEEAARSGSKPPLLIGVTILTSLDAAELQRTGFAGEPETLVLRLAGLCREAGLAGVVASPREAEALRRRYGPSFLCVTPGIRPEGSGQGDQVRVATPAGALRAGADYLVVGRPIHAAPDPEAAARSVLEEMAAVLADRE